MAKKAGAKSKYDEAAPKILEYLTRGYTQKKAAEMAGISEDVFYDWVNKYNEFSELVKKAKEEYRENAANAVERSLYEKATGYTVLKERTEYVSNAQGKPMISKQIKSKEGVAPDTAACIFMLTNLRPEKWKNRQHVDSEQKIEMTEKFKGFDAALPPTRPDEELEREIEKDREAFFAKYGEKE